MVVCSCFQSGLPAQVWRIGVMGNNASIKIVDKVLVALKEALQSVRG